VFKVLRAGKRLRGTSLDPFGRTHTRRVERQLIGDYERMVREALGKLTPETHAAVIELAELPDVVRGYEDIKLRNLERYRARAAELQARIARGEPKPPPTVEAELPIAPVRG
jgi:indolepyruvate ferredoxin oxidoreductase